MQIRISVILLALSLPIGLDAQPMGRPGEVISSDGHRTKGILRVDQSLQQITLESPESSKVFTVNDLLEFRTIDGRYVPMEVAYDADSQSTDALPSVSTPQKVLKTKLFVRVVEEGEQYSLYSLEDAQRPHFFVFDGRTVTELIKRRYRQGSKIVTLDQYKEQLREISRRCKSELNPGAIRFDEESLKLAIRSINNCQYTDYSQGSIELWRPGRVQLTDGRIETGQIYVGRITGPTSTIRFREQSQSEKSYSCNEIQAARLDDVKSYVSVQTSYDGEGQKSGALPFVKHPQLVIKGCIIAEVVLEDRFSLLHYSDSTDRHHYFLYDGRVAVELLNRVYGIGGRILKHEYYKQQLILLCRECPAVQKKMGGLRYLEEKMKYAVRLQNECAQTQRVDPDISKISPYP